MPRLKKGCKALNMRLDVMIMKRFSDYCEE